MLRPCLEEIERDGMGVFRCQLRITERHHRGIAGVAEGVELSAPGTAQAVGIVQLQLCRLGEFVVQEE